MVLLRDELHFDWEAISWFYSPSALLYAFGLAGRPMVLNTRSASITVPLSVFTFPGWMFSRPPKFSTFSPGQNRKPDKG